jgi:hypothetical protein
MLDWIRENSNMLSVIASFGTLLVWIFYAQLLFSGFKRQRRPRVLINKGVGFRDLDSPCLICNMSQEAIFLQFIMVRLKTNRGTFMVPATDSEEGAIDEGKEHEASRQGPLASGDFMKMKSFGLAVAKAAKQGDIQTTRGLPKDPDIRFYSVELTVIYIYGPDDQPVGAQRTFEFRYDEDSGLTTLHPTSIDSNRLTALHHRRQLRKWLHQYL